MASVDGAGEKAVVAKNVFLFEDKFADLDIVHEYDKQRADGVPLVIDNGSCYSHVGWCTDTRPRLSYKNLVAKSRSSRAAGGTTLVGNELRSFDVYRTWLLKSPFERDVVVNPDVQEQLLDYAFSHLGISGTEGHVPHPVVMSETVCNPDHCRRLTTELMFECYGVPSLAYGVAPLFALHGWQPGLEDALVVSIGFQCVHILPYLGGRLVVEHCRRVNLGVFHLIAYMQRLMQLKYPAFSNLIHWPRAEELLHKHSYVSTHYQADLDRWARLDYYDENVHKIQLPYNAVSLATVLDRRQQQAKRMQELAQRKRVERLAQDEEKLEQLLKVQAKQTDSEEAYQNSLQDFGLKSDLDLMSNIETLKAAILKVKDKISQASSDNSTHTNTTGSNMADGAD